MTRACVYPQITSSFKSYTSPKHTGCLARAKDWRYFKQDGKWFARETNTMPQWAGSCWCVRAPSRGHPHLGLGAACLTDPFPHPHNNHPLINQPPNPNKHRYYLRFSDPKNAGAAWGAEADRDWLPVDLYVGGQEHAVLHLLYARYEEESVGGV